MTLDQREIVSSLGSYVRDEIQLGAGSAASGSRARGAALHRGDDHRAGMAREANYFFRLSVGKAAGSASTGFEAERARTIAEAFST